MNMKKVCDFLRWFNEKSKKFSNVEFKECKRWFFSIYNRKGDLVYLETYTDEELMKLYREKR